MEVRPNKRKPGEGKGHTDSRKVVLLGTDSSDVTIFVGGELADGKVIQGRQLSAAGYSVGYE